MARDIRIDAPGLIQHVIARAVADQDLFLDDLDRRVFMARVSAVLAETGTTCLAIALMRNHVHLVLVTGPVPLSRVMHRILFPYAQTFNERHGRKGHLLGDRHKRLLVEDDAYLLESIRYVVLNPVRVGLIGDLETLARWPWVSFGDVLGRRPARVVDVPEVLALFGPEIKGAREAFAEFIQGGMEEAASDASSGVDHGRLVGDLPALGPAQVPGKRSLERVLAEVCRLRGVSIADVLAGRRRRELCEARALVVHVWRAVLGLRQRDIGEILRISQSAVSRLVTPGRALADEWLVPSRWSPEADELMLRA